MKKRFLGGLLALVLALGLLPCAAMAAPENLSAYVPVLEKAMQAGAHTEKYGEALFFDLDAQAPREMILVHCPEDEAHAVVEVCAIRDGKAVSLLRTPLFVMAGANTGSVSVGEYENRPILAAETTSTEPGENTVTVHGGFKCFVMKDGKVEIYESAAYNEVIDVSDKAPEDPVIYDQSDSVIQGEWHSYADYLDWRHSFVLLATNSGFTGADWDDDAAPLADARAYCASGFWDVPIGTWYAESVRWAAGKDIASGTGQDRFTPDGKCTRAQFVTFLWRAKGQPKAKTESKFSDVAAGAYYADAVAWAVGEGVTQGVGSGRFDPNGTLTRAQVVTFLHRLAGAPKAGSAAAFGDVPSGAYYAGAVAWAVEKGVTQGMSKTKFVPNDPCTRAQAVTFLHRQLGK